VKIISKEKYTSVEKIESNRLTYNGDEIVAEEAESIIVYSTDGRIVKQSTGTPVSTAELANGIYIAVAKYKYGTEVLRFVAE
jgi:hypothetical protein